MKIRKLQLKNIGVFDDETIEFQPCPAKDKAEIHILTGQNGSGKSTILQALACRFEYFMRANVTTPENSHPLPNNFHKRFRDKGSVSIISDYFSSGEHFVKTTLRKDENFLYPLGMQEEQSPSDYWVSSLSKGEPFDNEMSFRFAPFALSGYRHIQNERVEAIYEPRNFNPLFQSLEFIKDYDRENQLSINQLIANNISKRAIERERNKEKSERFATVLSSVNNFIAEITNWNISFEMQTEPIDLVLNLNGEELNFDLLPDGLRSLISWIADLLSRIDLLKWQDNLPIFEKNLILFLDEIEVHLHPAWQRKVLPVVQKLFKNSQIFVSTHSPFVVNSVDDAWVYKLELENGKARVAEVLESENSYSITQVLRDVLGVGEKFGKEVQDKLNKFEKLRDRILSNGSNVKDEEILLQLAKSLADEPSDQLKQIVLDELRQLNRIKGKEYSL